MGRPIQKKFFGNTNPDGIGGEGIASITLGGTNNSTGYSAGAADVSIAASGTPDSTQATGSISLYQNGGLLQGVTTFTSLTGTETGGGQAWPGVTQLSTSGTGVGAVFTITTSGAADYSGTTVTVTSPGSGYNTTETITIDGADLGGATTTNDLTFTISTFVTNGTIQSIAIVNAGSGYTSAPTVTLSNGTQGTLTATAVLTNARLNAFAFTNGGTFITGGSNQTNADIVKQLSARRFRVSNSDGTGDCRLVTATPSAAGQMALRADDSGGGAYYVQKLSARKATLVQTGAGPWEFTTGATAKWTFGAAVVNDTVTIENI